MKNQIIKILEKYGIDEYHWKLEIADEMTKLSLPPAEGAEAIDLKQYMTNLLYYVADPVNVPADQLDHWVEEMVNGIDEYFKSKQPTAEGAETNRQIRQLKEFHTAFRLPQRDIPTIIPPDEFKLRHKILIEEVGELSDAYFVGDIVEVADAITDCLYVLIGTAIQFGIADKLEACFDEVHRSNMSKLGSDGYPIMREDGKVMKGENYTRPDLKRILSESIAAQQQPTAEGAEEILRGIIEEIWGKPTPWDVFEDPNYKITFADAKVIAEKFATLHAQKIAEKMVSERLREELIKFGTATGWAVDIITVVVDEYLKSRETKGGKQ